MSFDFTNFHKADISNISASDIDVAIMLGVAGVITIPQKYIPEYLTIHMIDSADGSRVHPSQIFRHRSLLEALDRWHNYREDYIRREGTSIITGSLSFSMNGKTIFEAPEETCDLLDIRMHRREHVIPAVIACVWRACQLEKDTNGRTWSDSKAELKTALLYLSAHGVDLSDLAAKTNAYHRALGWSVPELDPSLLMPSQPGTLWRAPRISPG